MKSIKRNIMTIIVCIITMILAALKITGVITGSWWWVFSPILTLIALIITGVIYVIYDSKTPDIEDYGNEEEMDSGTEG